MASGAPVYVRRAARELGVRPVGQFEEGHVAQRELAEDLGAQVVPLDGDAVDRAPGDVGADGFAFNHGNSSSRVICRRLI
jgi:hypothetical protein